VGPGRSRSEDEEHGGDEEGNARHGS
jgi:hypothetical protein